MFYVGLNGVEVFDVDGNPAVVEEVSGVAVVTWL